MSLDAAPCMDSKQSTLTLTLITFSFRSRAAGVVSLGHLEEGGRSRMGQDFLQE